MSNLKRREEWIKQREVVLELLENKSLSLIDKARIINANRMREGLTKTRKTMKPPVDLLLCVKVPKSLIAECKRLKAEKRRKKNENKKLKKQKQKLEELDRVKLNIGLKIKALETKSPEACIDFVFHNEKYKQACGLIKNGVAGFQPLPLNAATRKEYKDRLERIREEKQKREIENQKRQEEFQKELALREKEANKELQRNKMLYFTNHSDNLSVIEFSNIKNLLDKKLDSEICDYDMERLKEVLGFDENKVADFKSDIIKYLKEHLVKSLNEHLAIELFPEIAEWIYTEEYHGEDEEDIDIENEDYEYSLKVEDVVHFDNSNDKYLIKINSFEDFNDFVNKIDYEGRQNNRYYESAENKIHQELQSFFICFLSDALESICSDNFEDTWVTEELDCIDFCGFDLCSELAWEVFSYLGSFELEDFFSTYKNHKLKSMYDKIVAR